MLDFLVFQLNLERWWFALPEITLVSFILTAMLLDAFVARRSVVYYWSQLGIFCSFIALLYVSINYERAQLVFNSFATDILSIAFKFFLLFIASCCLMFGKHYQKCHQLSTPAFSILLSLSLLGMMVMVSGYGMITLYLGLEVMSLSLYTMIASARERSLAVEAALKYFVLGAIASALLLYGMSMIFGVTGNLAIGNIYFFFQKETLDPGAILALNFGVVFVLIGIAFKLGAVPFHMWIPDVYHGSTSATTLWLSTAPKVAMVGLLIRLMIDGLAPLSDYWAPLFLTLGTLSVIFGTLAALQQHNIKRLLAYSTISHIGFVLLGFGSNTDFGYGAGIYYVLTYTLMSMVVWGVIIALNQKEFEADLIEDYKGLSKAVPWLSIVMLLPLLSMAGIPPFVGFYAKLLVLKSLIESGYTWIAVLVVTTTVVGVYYYLRIVRFMFFDEPIRALKVGIKRNYRIILILNSFLILLTGILPNAWIRAALSLI